MSYRKKVVPCFFLRIKFPTTMDFSDFLYEHYFEALGTLYLKFFFKSIFYPVPGRYLHVVHLS